VLETVLNRKSTLGVDDTFASMTHLPMPPNQTRAAGPQASADTSVAATAAAAAGAGGGDRGWAFGKRCTRTRSASNSGSWGGSKNNSETAACSRGNGRWWGCPCPGSHKRGSPTPSHDVSTVQRRAYSGCGANCCPTTTCQPEASGH
jgi:hypothetical protein